MGDKMCILIMDDDPYIRAYLADVLRHFGFEVDQAGSCQGVIRRLEKRSYDGLLLDQWAGDGCGEQVLDWLRRSGREEPVIMMSALADYDLWIKLMNKGVADLLAKPVQPSQLKRSLQLAMGDRFFSARVERREFSQPAL